MVGGVRERRSHGRVNKKREYLYGSCGTHGARTHPASFALAVGLRMRLLNVLFVHGHLVTSLRGIDFVTGSIMKGWRHTWCKWSISIPRAPARGLS